MSENAKPHKRNTSHLTIRKRRPLKSYSETAYRIIAQWLDVESSLLHEVLNVILDGEAYYRYRIPKHNSKEWREIHDPYGGLKEVQRRILDRLLYTIPVSNAAHGAVPARSVVTNALEHLPDASEIFALDIRKAFPSVHFSTVHRIFRKLIRPILKHHAGLPNPKNNALPPLDEAIHLLTAFCTNLYQPINGKKTPQAIWSIPQGAPTSGYILNLVCRPLDQKIFKIIEKYPDLQMRYSRFLDDMTISSPIEIPSHVQQELELAIIKNDFKINRAKTKLYKKEDNPVICGVLLKQGKLEADPDLITRCNRLLNESIKVKDPRLENQNRKKLRGILSFFQMVYGDHLPLEIEEPYKEYRKIRQLPDEPFFVQPTHSVVAQRAIESQDAFSLLAQWLDTTSEEIEKAQKLANSTDGYESWSINKKNGKQRHISSPQQSLKDIQNSILSRLLYHIPTSVASHGFVPGRSIVTNALAHTNAEYLINLDLKEAFPSVNKKRVKHLLDIGIGGLIKRFGFRCSHDLRGDLVDLIADLVTHNNELPQGAPTSGYLLNLACFTLDHRLFNLLAQNAPNVTYTRYADDLTFSSTEAIPSELLDLLQKTINKSGFRFNPKKTHQASRLKGQFMEICSIRIDGHQLRIPKQKLNSYRSIIRRAATAIPSGSLDIETRHKVQGIIGFVQMVYGDLPRIIDLPYKSFLKQHPECLPTGSSREKIAFYPTITPTL